MSERNSATREADATLVGFHRSDSGALRARLDNNCCVIRKTGKAIVTKGALRIYPLVDASCGAKHIAQYVATVEAGESPILKYPGSNVVLFILAGEGTVDIEGQRFSLTAAAGVCIKSGESFQLTCDSDESILLKITVCPQCAMPVIQGHMSGTFDELIPSRVQASNEEEWEKMSDRFFHVLIDEQNHSMPVTQFIGEIPLSRARHHRHLYEEIVTVLSGEGLIWTESLKAEVRPGDTIFLPMKQSHSLECTSRSGMRLMGVFFPSMSPAENY